MLSVPDGSAVVVTVATAPFNAPVPSFVAPLLNVTVPVGVPLAAVTVAVKVTDCPRVEGFADEDRVVVLVILFTFWLRVGDVLVAKFESPLYSALTE